jgi:glycosyltransferase involved in cell wall biosynthesis
MTRLCFISRFAASLFYPNLKPVHGGAETQFYHNSRELAKHPDLEVHLLLEGQPRQPPDIIDGVRIHAMPFNTGWRARFRFQRMLKSINADIQIQQGISSSTKEVAFYCKWRKSRFIYWIASNMDIDPTIQALEINRNKWFEWGMLNADRIIAQTTWQAEKLQENFSRSSTLITNGFPSRESPSAEPRKHILWAGRFTPVKRPELFLEIAENMPGEQFIMLAPLTNQTAFRHHERHKARIRALHNLEFYPGVTIEQVEKYMRNTKLFVNTSITEGFPNTFVQAMWSGTPIASLSFDPDQIIRSQQLGIYPTDDLDGFMENIRTLLHDKNRLNECGMNAWNHTNRHHNLSKNMELFRKVLLELH